MTSDPSPTTNKTTPSDDILPFNPYDQYVHYRNLINGFPDTIVRDYIERAITEAFERGRYSARAYPASGSL